MRRVDINCDMGESFGAYTLGMDADVIRHISSVNIACGFHAGDPGVMNRTVKLAFEHGVGVGAHPGFPDLLGFGRRKIDCSLDEIRNDMVYQVGAIQGFCRLHGTRLQHVKPHGSLYNLAAGNPDVWRVIAQAVAAFDADLILVTLAGRQADVMGGIGKEAGVRVVFEGFPDRAYTPEGRLVPRRLPGAVIHDPEEVSERAVTMVMEGSVSTLDGRKVPLEVDTLCVHGDHPGAVETAALVRQRLEEAGVAVVALGELR